MSCYVEKVIEIAMAEVGYLEKETKDNLDNKTANAGHNNYTKYARDLDKISGFYNGGKQGYAWCECFLDWCFVQAYGVSNAKKLLCQPNKSAGAGCASSMKYYKNKGQLATSPAIGDQIFFNNKNGEVSHTGLVYKVDKTYVYTVEGNTSSASGVVANGGSVCKKKYRLTYQYIAGYGRPKYDVQKEIVVENVNTNVKDNTSKNTSTTAKAKVTVLEWQKAAMADGYSFPKYGADGEWGSECMSVAKQALVKKTSPYTNKNLTKIVQKAVGVSVDGLCGVNTDAAIKSYQKMNGLVADGIVGLNTWKKILGIA